MGRAYLTILAQRPVLRSELAAARPVAICTPLRFRLSWVAEGVRDVLEPVAHSIRNLLALVVRHTRAQRAGLSPGYQELSTPPPDIARSTRMAVRPLR